MNMSVGTLVSVERYLRTSYDPDVEYVDGVLEERSAGDWLHSLVQSNIIFALRTKHPQLKVVPELRSQTSETRFRLPDVTVLTAPPKTRYLTEAALIAIEIISEDDKMTKIMEKLAEYEAKGVPNIWLIDPRLERISVCRDGTLVQIPGNKVETPSGDIELTREEIFRK